MKNAIILVIDDAKANIDTFIELLSVEYEVLAAINGLDGLEVVADNQVDLILLDVNMPNMNGYEVSKILKSKDDTKNIPIIFITVNDNENSIEKAYDAGAADYIVNPFKPKELKARVKTQLNLLKKTRELAELNASLEQKVKQEVEKNRIKDQHMIQQAKFAQMGEMLSMIAHQWRQPLAAISATSASLELKSILGKADSKTIVMYTKNISDYSQHLSSTIDDFRTFFKPDKQKSESSYSKILDSVFGIIEISLKNKNIKLIKELNLEIKFVTHINELKQVILNLIKNAEDILIEKEVKDPYIKISTYSKDDKYILEVSDNGGGVAEDILPKIFDAYFSTKLDKGGTGLGLYMSKMIIDDHCSGKLSVSNDEFGAVFCIELRSVHTSHF
ncbi:MAG: sensor histidine kinase [Epsilonproteobacteria bacterium]|nr:MAG: sensor histidine kinase [Campylobacterota bacterium]